MKETNINELTDEELKDVNGGSEVTQLEEIAHTSVAEMRCRPHICPPGFRLVNCHCEPSDINFHRDH